MYVEYLEQTRGSFPLRNSTLSSDDSEWTDQEYEKKLFWIKISSSEKIVNYWILSITKRKFVK